MALTNTEKLEQKIKDSGYRIEYVAEKCGLSSQGLLKKRNNETEFKASEILILKTLLNLTDEETNEIFLLLRLKNYQLLEGGIHETGRTHQETSRHSIRLCQPDGGKQENRDTEDDTQELAAGAAPDQGARS